MKKRFCSILLSLALLITVTLQGSACNEDQSDTYVAQILFGASALSYESDETFDLLMDALYLCSEQADNSGADELKSLKSSKVSRLPSIDTINVNSASLLACSHTAWEEEYLADAEAKNARKKILRNTVNKVFDFGLINNWFNSDEGQCDSFAALLYYSHILADYLADDPEETEITVGNTYVSAYSGQASVEVNGNKPSFTSAEKNSTESFAEFSQLDNLGRAGVAFANIGPDEMASAGSRDESMSSIYPSGWNQNQYEGIVNTTQLYNRCHLIAHQLSGNDTEINLITGTRYLNETGMQPYEEEIAAYINDTGNHVLYRVTPVYSGDNLLASGVQLEAYSVEDKGEGISFNVYCYNVQPGVDINYQDGTNELSDTTVGSEDILPFVVCNPSDSNPDLIYEMNKYLKELFENQKDTGTYISLMNGINGVASDARALDEDDTNQGRYYMALKDCEYDYLEQLTLYVPILLSNEDFFNSVFQ